MKKIIFLALTAVLILAFSTSVYAVRLQVQQTTGGSISVLLDDGTIVDADSGPVTIGPGHHWVTIIAEPAPGYQLRDDAVFRIEFTNPSSESQMNVPAGERIQLRHNTVGQRLITVRFEPTLGGDPFEPADDERVFYELPRHGFHEIEASCLANLRFLLRDEFDGLEPTNLMVREHNRNWRATGRHLTNANPRLLQMGHIQNESTGIWTVYDVNGDWCLRAGFNYSVEFYFGNQSVIIWFVVS